MTDGPLDAYRKLRAAGDLQPDPMQQAAAERLEVLCGALTGYALGRAVQLSDRELVDELTETLAGGGRWSDVMLIIVRSEQFRCIRPAMSAGSTNTAVPNP